MHQHDFNQTKIQSDPCLEFQISKVRDSLCSVYIMKFNPHCRKDAMHGMIEMITLKEKIDIFNREEMNELDLA